MIPVLIVDDDPAIRKLLQIICNRIGLSADAAADGAEALEKMRSTEYSIAVVDLMMPRLDGFHLVEQLRVREHRPTVFIVTAMTDSYLAALDENVVHTIIRKPFDIDVVGKLIADMAQTEPRATS